jgi:cytochrome c-type biogenesis protein CcmH
MPAITASKEHDMTTEAAPEQTTSRTSWWLLGGATLALAGALGFALTRSDLSGGPSEVSATAGAPIGDITALEAAVRDTPDNATAWAALGEARFAAENYRGAADAFRRATTLAPAVALHWSALGEALVLASRVEPLPEPALAAFRRAIGLDARDPRARYFLAVKRDLDGDHAGAVNDWLALLADTPRGAPWEASVRQTIEQVARINNIDVTARLAAVRQPEVAAQDLPVAARAIPGPTRQQMEAAGSMPKGQQDQMIAQMLGQLEERLRQNPRQPDRWIMLMRSRMTLGEGERALDALRAAIAANPDDAARLRREAQLLGVPGA